MRNGLLRTWSQCLAGLSTAFVAAGFVEPQDTPKLGFLESRGPAITVVQRVLRPDLTVNGRPTFEGEGAGFTSDEQAEVKYDRLTGGAPSHLRWQSPRRRAPDRAAGVDAFIRHAMTYVTEHADIFGVSPADLRLKRDALLLSGDEQFLKFEVLRDGLVIDDASIDFRFKFGKLLQVVNQSYAEAKSDARPKIDGLLSKAEGQIYAEKLTEQGEAYRVGTSSHGYRLIRVTELKVEIGDHSYVAQVESATGKIFEMRPTWLHLSGSASGDVFPRWYNETAVRQPFGELTLKWGQQSLMTSLQGTFSDAPDDATPALNGFEGKRVRIVTKTGTAVEKKGELSGGDWQVVFERDARVTASADKDVAQSMVFYHTNAMIQHARSYIESPWFDKPLTANVNLSQSCNAHWDGSTINFYAAGRGCANTGLISDVVFHEWGHGLDANTGGIRDYAFSEGFGDIMSLIMTRSPIIGMGFETGGGVVRDLEPNKVYPKDKGGGSHAEGRIIGSTFWDLYTYLKDAHGDDEAIHLLSKYSLKMVFTAARYTEVYDAVLVIDDDNADLKDRTPNFCLINKAFAEHGLATADSTCKS